MTTYHESALAVFVRKVLVTIDESMVGNTETCTRRNDGVDLVQGIRHLQIR